MDLFAPSQVNMCAAIYGHDVGQPGADPSKLTKLFSAAEWWGPGPGGWQRWDQTWQCVDQRDTLGRTIREQGRLLWHRGRPDSAIEFPAPVTQPATSPPVIEPGAFHFLPMLLLVAVAIMALWLDEMF